MERHKRYLFFLWRHATFRKLLNMLKIEYRLAANSPKMEGLYPYILFVEISNACNLRCPICLMGQRKLIQRKNRMSFENYVKVLEPLKDYLVIVFLYNWSEPFLNKDIYRIIEWNTKADIATVVSSNLNSPVNAISLIESDLDMLIISGDGITQDIYKKYRIGGNLDIVFENLSKIVAAKKKARSSYPFIEWQCLVTRHNEPQMDDIRRIALERGADIVRFVNLNFYSVRNGEDLDALKKEWLPENPIYREAFGSEVNLPEGKRIRRPCYWLWRSPIINVDGSVGPCCMYDVSSWGNALDLGFVNVWNNDIFREARLRSQRNRLEPKHRIICDRCKAPFIFKR
jgi:MoaA/NifB/PqqE/SkfB family radical SAM enzyme